MLFAAVGCLCAAAATAALGGWTLSRPRSADMVRRVLRAVAPTQLAAAAIVEDGRVDAIKAKRYAGWDGDFGTTIGGLDLAGIADLAVERDIDPKPVSGQQERLENLINRFL